MEVCSDACSVLGDVVACLSLDWSTFAALEVGFMTPSAAGGQSVAGDWKGLSGRLVSTVAGWLGLGLGTLVLSESWATSLWVNCWCWTADSGSFSLAS